MAASRSGVNSFPQQISFCSLLGNTQQAKAEALMVPINLITVGLILLPLKSDVGWGFFLPLSFVAEFCPSRGTPVLALPGRGVDAQLPGDGRLVVLLNIWEKFTRLFLLPA